MTHLKGSLHKNHAFESSCLLSVVVYGGHLCLLSSPRKGPAGPWTQGKLIASPAWEHAAYSLKKGRDGVELAGSAAQASEEWAAALCCGGAPSLRCLSPSRPRL